MPHKQNSVFTLQVLPILPDFIIHIPDAETAARDGAPDFRGKMTGATVIAIAHVC